MATVISILLVVAGAALVWVVDGTVAGLDATIPGVVLMSVGGLSAFASIVLSGRAVPSPGADDESGRALGPVDVEPGQDEDARPLEHGWPQ
ncbi:MAG: hypothetical protein WD689_02635 [Gaiellaceae bacterium]